ncbi:MAG: DEAD/DEAH box helicase, partial [Candidatus Thermoplasmatota archaeon]
PTIPVPLKTTPFDHQVRAYIIGTTLDSSAFLMEQGTGKTLAAIAVAGKRFMDCQVKRMIVMCPLSVMYVWKNEFEQHADFPFSIRICHGNPKKRLAAFARSNPNELTVVVVNYDSVISRTRKERDEKGAVVKKVEIGGLADQIIAWKPDLVLLDESQRVKEPDSKRSKLVHRIGDATTYKMILTGTPVGNSPLDIWSQYRFLDVRIFGDNYYRFRDEYAVLREMRVRAGIDKYGNPIFRTIKVVDGYKNLGQMTEKVHSIAYRVTKDEALDLPPEIHQSIHCQLVASRPYYDAMKKDMAVEFCGMEVKANMVLPQIMRLAEITGGFLPMKKDGVQEIVQVGTEKMDALVDFITYFPTNKKLVIFCRFTPEINAIVERLKSMDITVEKIDGSVPDPKVRNDIIESFQHAQDPRVLVIQSQTGGLGITLHRADTIVFYSGNESLLDYEQAKARVQRYGQTGDKVTYVHIVAKGTIDEKIVAVLRAKKDLANIVVDELLDDDEDVYDRS